LSKAKTYARVCVWERVGRVQYSSSSSICGVGGNPAYRTSAFEAVFNLTPVLVPPSSPEALHSRRRERPLLARGGIMGEKWPVKFSRTIRLTRNYWVL
jgi:hypothetical protein